MIIFLKNFDPIKTIKKYSPDVIIVSKMFHNDVINLIKEAKKNNIKIISIFDDWFVDKKITYKHHLINLEAAKLSDVNVVKTSEAAKVLKDNLGIASQIIPDYLRFDKAIGDLHFNDPIKVSWFGMPTNFDTLLFGINQIVVSNIACELSIISSQFRFLQKNLTTIDKTKIKLLQDIDEVYINFLKEKKLYDKIWQAFAVLLLIKTIGVMGDQRSYEYVCALRAVTSVDGMTAEPYYFNSEDLAQISTKIVNEVKGVNRVVYDYTSKPPGTIEWE